MNAKCLGTLLFNRFHIMFINIYSLLLHFSLKGDDKVKTRYQYFTFDIESPNLEIVTHFDSSYGLCNLLLLFYG